MDILLYALTVLLGLLLYFSYSPGEAQKILLFGMILPVFLISAVYYRLKKNHLEKKSPKTSG